MYSVLQIHETQSSVHKNNQTSFTNGDKQWLYNKLKSAKTSQ